MIRPAPRFVSESGTGALPNVRMGVWAGFAAFWRRPLCSSFLRFSADACKDRSRHPPRTSTFRKDGVKSFCCFVFRGRSPQCWRERP